MIIAAPAKMVPTIRNDHIRILTTANDSCVATAIVQEAGEVDGGRCDQPHRIEEREREAESAEEDGEASNKVFDDGGFFAAGLRDPGKDRRGDSEEHDHKIVRPVDDVPQGIASNADGGVENYKDRGCVCYPALQNEAENRRAEYRDEGSWRERGVPCGWNHRNPREIPALPLRITKISSTMLIGGDEDSSGTEGVRWFKRWVHRGSTLIAHVLFANIHNIPGRQAKRSGTGNDWDRQEASIVHAVGFHLKSLLGNQWMSPYSPTGCDCKHVPIPSTQPISPTKGISCACGK
jgi:hypothetical protein